VNGVDRENVIKGLEQAKKVIELWIPMFEQYNTPAVIDVAIDLLKEREAVEPIKKDTVEITARYEFDCPCGAPLLIGQPYCADCGRSVKWE